MSKRMYHPCHKLSVPSAKIFWCRHCMQMFEDAISRWKHSKTCRDGIKYKDTDGQVIQMYVKPDKVSYTANVSPGQIVHKPQVKKTSADLKCVICQAKFFSLHDMREHVKFPCQRQYTGYPESDESDTDENRASSLKIRRVETNESNNTALSVLAEASKHVESLAEAVKVDLIKSQINHHFPDAGNPGYPNCYSVEGIAQQGQRQEIVVEVPRPKNRVDLEPVVIVIQAEDGQDIPEASWDIDTIQKCVKETVTTLPLGQIIQLQINVKNKIVKHFTVGFKGAIYPIDEADLPSFSDKFAEVENTAADIDHIAIVREEQVVETSEDHSQNLTVLADILGKNSGQVTENTVTDESTQGEQAINNNIWTEAYPGVVNIQPSNSVKVLEHSYQSQGISSESNSTTHIRLQDPSVQEIQKKQLEPQVHIDSGQGYQVPRANQVPVFSVQNPDNSDQIPVQHGGNSFVSTSSGVQSLHPIEPEKLQHLGSRVQNSSLTFTPTSHQRFQISNLVQSGYPHQPAQFENRPEGNQLQPPFTEANQQAANQFASVETQTPHVAQHKFRTAQSDHSYQESFLSYIDKTLTKAELNQEALNNLQSIIEAQEAAETLTKAVNQGVACESGEVIEISQVADDFLRVEPQSGTDTSVVIQTTDSDTQVFVSREEQRHLEAKLVADGQVELPHAHIQGLIGAGIQHGSGVGKGREPQAAGQEAGVEFKRELQEHHQVIVIQNTELPPLENVQHTITSHSTWQIDNA